MSTSTLSKEHKIEILDMATRIFIARTEIGTLNSGNNDFKDLIKTLKEAYTILEE